MVPGEQKASYEDLSPSRGTISLSYANRECRKARIGLRGSSSVWIGNQAKPLTKTQKPHTNGSGPTAPMTYTNEEEILPQNTVTGR